MQRREVILSIVLLAACSAGLTLAAAERPVLSPRVELSVRRRLHPLPHELRFGDALYRVAPGACSMPVSADTSKEEKGLLEEFRASWGRRFGIALTIDAPNGPSMKIVAGTIATCKAVREAGAKGLLDLKYLSTRPNADQAYALTVAPTNGAVAVHIAANSVAGLRYGLTTFDQILAAGFTHAGVNLPEVRIVDWPDINERGLWHAMWVCLPGRPGEPPKPERERFDRWMRRYAAMKMNNLLLTKIRILPEPLKQGKISVSHTHGAHDFDLPVMGRRHGVHVMSRLHHLDQLFEDRPDIRKAFPGIVGRRKKGSVVWPWCYSNPQSQAVMGNIFEAIARDIDSDSLTVWLSEIQGPTGGCQCERCKGDTRGQFVREIEHVTRAFKKARAIRPGLKMTLTLSQGSYPHNFALLPHIPNDVTLLFYHGHMTYKTYHREYNLPPSIQEIKRRGHLVGSIPMVAASHTHHGYMLFPFTAPLFVKLRMAEVRDRGLDVVQIFAQPNLLVADFNIQATAEFSWNASGRTPREFALSWAARRGMADPEKAADVIAMLEYPTRALSACMHANRMKPVLARMVNLIGGKAKKTWDKLNPLYGFEYKNHEEMARVLAMCEHGAGLAAELGDDEMRLGSVVLKRWIRIFERYAFIMEHRDEAPAKQRAVAELVAEVEALRKDWHAWAALLSLADYHRRTTRNVLDDVLSAFDPLLPEAQRKRKVRIALLEAAARAGMLTVAPLANKWRFRTDPADRGVKGKWYATHHNDTSWAMVRSDTGFGWDSQGFPGYLGYAWYRQSFLVPKQAFARKRVYLLFGAVDEDAEVYVNGRKTFRHDHTTTGLRPGATWNKPFCFDVKPYLASGKTGTEANTIAIRVYNRSGMGGVWKPAHLIASDLNVTADALIEYLVSTKR